MKSTEQSLGWISPVGFAGIQPYFTGAHSAPDLRKNIGAFPPNYIHSLDAAHMIMTSIECHNANIEFVAVHDCFWTHACSVPTMSKILRDEFVNLHKEPLLQTLKEDLFTALPQHSRNSFPDIPNKGTLNIDMVPKSEFFFC